MSVISKISNIFLTKKSITYCDESMNYMWTNNIGTISNYTSEITGDKKICHWKGGGADLD